MNRVSHALDWAFKSQNQSCDVVIDPGVVSLDRLSERELKTRFITKEIIVNAASLAVIGLCMMAVLAA
jgi:hypothetical protein